MKKTILNKRIIIDIILYTYVFILTGCTSLYAYMYVLTTEYDGIVVLKKEGDVKKILKQIIEDADQYIMKAYTRTAISYKIRKTNDTTHSFYVIMRAGEMYVTLSFSATGKWATSEGAWAINTDTDISSYEIYLTGENRWHIEEIKTNKGINTLRTITNILEKIESDTTYYYRAPVNKNDKIDNCNTALLETLVEI
jgi:hypothetical protein